MGRDLSFHIGKLLLMLLVFVTLTGGMVCMANAEESIAFADVKDGFWGKTAIDHWSSRGIINGDGINFHPNDSITRAQMTSILVRVFGYGDKANNPFADVKPGDWYCDALAKAYAGGILQGNFDGNGNRIARPNDSLTRAEAAALFSRVFSVPGSTGNRTKFMDTLPDWAKEDIYGMEAAGYVQGINGLYHPLNNLTRAEAVQILDNIVKLFISRPGSYSTDISGNVVVNTPDAVLKNMKITGSLYLSEGIGEGAFTLENISVTGNTFIRGGGAGKITVKNSNLGKVSIEKDSIVLEETQPTPTPTPTGNTGNTGGSGGSGGNGGSGGSGDTGENQAPGGSDMADY